MNRVEYLRKVLSEFNRQKINYCVLRNYEFLLGSGDPVESIDTLVSKVDYPRVDWLLKELGFSKRKQQFSLVHKAYFKHVGTKLVSFDVQVGGIHWNDMVYLGEKVLQNRVWKNYFYVLGDDDTFIMLLVHSILGKRYFKPKYQRILLSLVSRADKEYVLEKLARIFNRRIAKRLWREVIRNDFKMIRIKSLVGYFLIKGSHSITFTKLFFRWLRWKKLFKAYPLISFIGPDGAGKSTMVKGLVEHLRENSRKVALVYTGRGRNQILPFRRIGRVYKRLEKKKDGKKREVGVSNGKVSLLRKTTYTLAAPIFTLDLLLRYVQRIWLRRRKRQIVITDRYCSDIFLMKHVSKRYKRLLLKLFPLPTMTFYLYNSAEVLHVRRPEESVIELERQMGLFSELQQKLGAVVIKTDHLVLDQEKIVQEVDRLLLREWY